MIMAGEPFLPIELEREIFEMSAIRHPEIAAVLLRVARRVLIWSVAPFSVNVPSLKVCCARIEPLLYRVMRVGKSRRRAAAFLEATKTKPPAFFADSVRALCFDNYCDWSVDEARNVVKLCRGVTNFASVGRFYTPAMLPVLASMRIQRLVVCLAELFGSFEAIDFTHALFSKITHLTIGDCFSGVKEHMYANLHTLPALTHLCLYKDASPTTSTLELLLRACVRLELLVVLREQSAIEQSLDSLIYVATRMAAKTPVRDVRVVVAMYAHCWVDWNAGAAGLPDLWTRAENAVAQRRGGDLDGMNPVCLVQGTDSDAHIWHVCG
ncbi:hypothetical protein GGX14DRAFT_674287 [Mycena pura]|uniref:Uncharacterized protein n=1 Tax=Mycena pura TaxID=153505 RepID=A0AAD6UV90_9AGAR|nr:hypothetical protein GGX14DRAFT_674287 [Mycena pura]